MDLLKSMEDYSRKNPRDIVLAEGEDIRTVEAAHNLLKNRTVKKLWILGNKDKVKSLAHEGKFNIDGAILIDPATAENTDAYAMEYFEMREGKTPKEEAMTTMRDVIAYGCMMTHKGVCEGMVGGASNTTGHLIRNAIRIVGCKPGIKTVSSCFLMLLPEPTYGAEGAFIYSDCGVVPNPDPLQLADITMGAVESFRKLVKQEPVVGLLSFSTKGSAKHPDVDKVLAACEELKKRKVDFKFDGEFQVDAAIVPKVGAKKAPGSEAAGKANVLIFPDLDAGNIAYKLTERLAKAIALGPLMQGLAKPVNDLSRGCSASDIYQVSIITENQA